MVACVTQSFAGSEAQRFYTTGRYGDAHDVAIVDHARALGQSPQYWLNLQAAYDLKIAEREIGARLKAVLELESA